MIGALLLILLLVKFLNRDQTATLLASPQCGQIYIFHAENRYAPMRLDSISADQFFMRNYLFVFADAIPTKDQILSIEFDLEFMAIYEREELTRLYEEGRLVKIYAP